METGGFVLATLTRRKTLQAVGMCKLLKETVVIIAGAVSLRFPETSQLVTLFVVFRSLKVREIIEEEQFNITFVILCAVTASADFLHQASNIKRMKKLNSVLKCHFELPEPQNYTFNIPPGKFLVYVIFSYTIKRTRYLVFTSLLSCHICQLPEQ